MLGRDLRGMALFFLLALFVSPLPARQQEPRSVKEILKSFAEDFRAAFGVGESERMISTVDAQGVAFAAIQGLNAKFDAAIAERDARIVKQDQEIAELRRAVEVLLTRTSPDGRVAERR